MPERTLQIRYLGLQPYLLIYQAMQQFTAQRDDSTADEVWLLQHQPVYTQGLNGKPEHILTATTIPVVATDRGGQVTYHGPGQLIAYCLLDIKRSGIGIRQLVTNLENTVIALLADYGIHADARRDAPGVYVADSKIASLGLRLKRGYSYHGLSLNVAMDLAPFQAINPCGYSGLQMTQLIDCSADQSFTIHQVSDDLLPHLAQHLSYTIGSASHSLPAYLELKTDTHTQYAATDNS